MISNQDRPELTKSDHFRKLGGIRPTHRNLQYIYKVGDEEQKIKGFRIFFEKPCWMGPIAFLVFWDGHNENSLRVPELVAEFFYKEIYQQIYL